jgi:Uricase
VSFSHVSDGSNKYELAKYGYSKKLFKPFSVSFSHVSDGSDKYELAKYGYGKNHIKLLHVHREGPHHTVREYEVDTRLRLKSQKDYLVGDNKDIIATDTQKNTVYLLAKKHGVSDTCVYQLLCSGIDVANPVPTSTLFFCVLFRVLSLI